MIVASNSSVASQAETPASSPLATLLNSATNANGQPSFAQSVRDALNKSTPGGTQNQEQSQPAAPPPSAPTCTGAPQAGPTEPSLDSEPPKPAAVSKQPDPTKAKPANADDVSSNLSTFLLLGIPLVPAAPVQNPDFQSFEKSVSNESTASAPDAEARGTKVDASLAGDDSQGPGFLAAPMNKPAVDSIRQTAFSATQQLLAAAPTATSTTQSWTKSADGPQPPTISSSLALSTSTSSDSGAADSASGSTLVARASGDIAGDADGSSASKIAAHFVDFETPSLQKQAQTVDPLPAAVHTASEFGEASTPAHTDSRNEQVSSIGKQLSTLQATSAGESTATSIQVDVSRVAIQSQLSKAAASAALSGSSLPHSLASAGLASLAPLGSAHAPQDSHIAAPQSVTPNSANHGGSRDASSNQDTQDSPSTGNSEHSSEARNSSTKSEASNFSEFAGDPSATRPSAQPVSPTVSSVATAIVAPEQSPTSGSHLAQESLPSAPQQALPPTSAPQSAEFAAGNSVNAAQLTNAATHGEMRIAMQTDGLGAIELHARVNGDAVGAAIVVEKRDAHAALASELPALQQSLSDKQLRVVQVALSHGSLGSTAGHPGGNTQSGQRNFAQPARPVPVWSEPRAMTPVAWYVSESTGIFTAQGRLSVKA